MNNDHKIRGTVCGIAATVTWGINGTVSQYVLQHYDLDSMWLACWRMLFAGFVIFLFTIIRKGRGCFEILKDKKSLRDLIIFAVFGLLFNQLCYFTAIQNTDAGTATVMQSMSTIVILIATSFTARRFPGFYKTAAVLLALTGVYLISTESGIGLSLTPKGLFWGLLLAIAAASYILLSRPLVDRWDSLTVVGYGMLLGGILFSIIYRPLRFHPGLDTAFYFYFAFIVLFGTILAFSLFLLCIHDHAYRLDLFE